MYEIFDKLLKEHDVTAYRVSVDTGVSQSSLSDWKTGKSKPKYENMKKIADYFGVTVEYLNGEADERKPNEKRLINEDEELTDYLDELRSRPEMRMLFSVAKGATKSDVERAVRIIEALRRPEDVDS